MYKCLFNSLVLFLILIANAAIKNDLQKVHEFSLLAETNSSQITQERIVSAVEASLRSRLGFQLELRILEKNFPTTINDFLVPIKFGIIHRDLPSSRLFLSAGIDLNDIYPIIFLPQGPPAQNC